jgi:2-keto-4-pentenoate hydratase/2-oxohepta-3-ene-1,7-dioic acid hydratase in catechol pathway
VRWCSWIPAGAPGSEAPRLGALLDRDQEPGWMLDVGAFSKARQADTPADLVDLIEASPAAQQRIADLVQSAQPDDPGWLRQEQASFLAPVRAPNALRDFMAFPDHVAAAAARRGRDIPEPWNRIPVYYKGNRRSIVGPQQAVRRPSYSQYLDYECEIAAILGRPGRDLPVATAADAIFGYTVMNDWSARDIQSEEMACWLGPAKGKDFATSLGPVVVTPDEWSPDDPHQVTATVDGTVWSKGTTQGRRWSFAEMISWVSRDEDVYPTDVFGSGTFGGGCGLDLGRRLPDECTVAIDVDGLGELANRVERTP